MYARICIGQFCHGRVREVVRVIITNKYSIEGGEVAGLTDGGCKAGRAKGAAPLLEG